MAKEFNKDKVREKALRILREHKDIYFFSDLATELGYSRQYLYERELCPDKDDIIKEALAQNKRKLKKSIRNKWYNNDNATTQLALYKLVADEDELRRLNNNTEISVGQEGLKIVVADERAKKALEEV